jgi:hypothetical protein
MALNEFFFIAVFSSSTRLPNQWETMPKTRKFIPIELNTSHEVVTAINA